ncbi:MAG: MarR family transcriptional regulator [Candidatus Nanoarchaeia archaeon]
MIDFACKRFNLNDIVKCALGLTRAECKVFRYFFENSAENITTECLAEKLELNLSTIQKATKKLNEHGIILRYQKNLEGGGYIYTYEANSKKQIRRILKKIINNWAENVGRAIDDW